MITSKAEATWRDLTDLCGAGFRSVLCAHHPTFLHLFKTSCAYSLSLNLGRPLFFITPFFLPLYFSSSHFTLFPRISKMTNEDNNQTSAILSYLMQNLRLPDTSSNTALNRPSGQSTSFNSAQSQAAPQQSIGQATATYGASSLFLTVRWSLYLSLRCYDVTEPNMLHGCMQTC